MNIDLSALGAKALTTRGFVRAPIEAFRCGLGFVFAGRLMMLEHRGRTSGRHRYVVLEVVDRPDKDTVIIASGFGDRAQWYRNLAAEPRCAVSIGARTHVPAVAHLLSPEESASGLERYSAEHPGAWEQLRGAITRATGDPESDIPLVRLELRS